MYPSEMSKSTSIIIVVDENVTQILQNSQFPLCNCYQGNFSYRNVKGQS